jgi:tRNA(His) guanylyltransferase
VTLGDRVKRYEAAYRPRFTPRSCLIIRVDGRAFHTFTRGCDRPFDLKIIEAMVHATKKAGRGMQGFKLAYTQSDEATFLLTDFDNFETEGWFDYELNKVVSISASLFTAHFNDWYGALIGRTCVAQFDSRAFVVPTDDWPNVFIWRQRDWERNSVQMFAQAHFSHKQLQGKKHPEIHDMLHEKGENWALLDDQLKNGTFVTPAGGEFCGKVGFEPIRFLAGLGEH